MKKNYAEDQLQKQYEYVCKMPSDIQGHIPVLYSLAKECSSVIEIGMRDMISSWGIFQGLRMRLLQEIPEKLFDIDFIL